MDFLSYRYQLGAAGFNYNNNKSDMSPGSMIEGSKNFNILENSIETRGGTDVVLSLPDRSSISSLYPLINNDKIRMLSTNYAGELYVDTTKLYSTATRIDIASYIEWNNNIIISTGVDIPQVWDTISDSTYDYPDEYLSPDWKLDGDYPSIIVLHGSGESVRAWALGTIKRPNSIYYSDILDLSLPSPVPNFAEVDNSGKFAINLLPTESIVGGIVYGDKLFVFTETNAFIPNTTSSDTKEWEVVKAPWKGGTCSQNTLVNTENDVISMASDGTIYSLNSVMTYGDYKKYSLSSSNSMYRYINEKINIDRIKYSHMMYDPKLRAVKIFVSEINKEYNELALVYFIDKGSSLGWSIHKNELVQSGYDACSSVALNTEKGIRTFTGDYFGRIWELERPYIVDDLQFFSLKIKTPWISCEDFRQVKRFSNGWLELQNYPPMKINIEMTTQKTTSERTITRQIAVNGEAIFDEAIWDDAIFADEDHKTKAHYLIHKIGVALKQSFEFIPMDADAAKWDISEFDDENATFGYGYTHYKKFSIISNILDFKPVSKRVNI